MSTPERQASLPEFIRGGGDLGILMRAHDWAATLLGPPAKWPPSLRMTIQLMLNSGFPMMLFWGPDLIQFYNDAYRDAVWPDNHTPVLGMPARQTWADIWHIIGPQVDQVMSGGGATWDENRLVPIPRDGKLIDQWWTYSYSPIEDGESINGVLVISSNVTVVILAQRTLDAQVQRLAALFEHAPSFVCTLRGPDHVYEITNAAYRKLLGNRELIGLTVRQAIPEAERQGFLDLLDDVYSNGATHVRTRMPIELDQPSGETRRLFVDFVFQPVTAADGTINGVFVEGVDVTDHVRSDDTLRLMNAELKHRGKNMLTLVNAIASQTFRGSEQLAVFQSRIRTFDKAHEILTRQLDSTAEIHDLIAVALGPHLEDTGRVRFSGPPVSLGSRHAVALSLTIHELGTNAAKYGALSNDAGQVTLTWGASDPGPQATFRLEWRESGGPVVAEPRRRGFGSSIMEHVLGPEFGGTVEVRFAPEGFVLVLTAPAPGIVVGAPQVPGAASPDVAAGQPGTDVR